MERSFCPKDCLMQGLACNSCGHSQDRKFKEPQPIEVKVVGGWKQTHAVGRSDDKLYLEDHTSIGINSSLIK